MISNHSPLRLGNFVLKFILALMFGVAFFLLAITQMRMFSFHKGVIEMSRSIETSLNQAGLEGMSQILKQDVKACTSMSDRRRDRVRQLEFFDFDGRITVGSQVYKECYIEKLRVAGLMSNPEMLDRALMTAQAQ